MNNKIKSTLTSFSLPWKKTKEEIKSFDLAKENNLNPKRLSWKAKLGKIFMFLFSLKMFYALVMSEDLFHLKYHSIWDILLSFFIVLVIIVQFIPQKWLIKVLKVEQRQEKRRLELLAQAQQKEQEKKADLETYHKEQKEEHYKTMSSNL